MNQKGSVNPMTILAATNDTYTNNESSDDLAPCECQWDAKRERWDPNLRCDACSARAQEWRRLCAEAEATPVVNLHGTPLDQLPALTLADDLAEVGDAVALGVSSATWARQARRNILDRHRAEHVRPDESPEGAPAPAPPLDSEWITETTGCDPPAIPDSWSASPHRRVPAPSRTSP